MYTDSFNKLLLCLAFLFVEITTFGQGTRGFAVLVGVSTTTAQCVPGTHFDNSATAGVGNDLARMRELLDRAGFEPQRITTLTKSDQTTPVAILTALRNIKPAPGDLVVFYFSGHGDSVKDLNGDEEDGNDELLVGSNACLLDDELRSIWVSYGPQVRVVMIVDACHAGTIFSIQDFAVSKDGRQRPANERPNRNSSTRAERGRPLTATEKEAQKTVKFRRERGFENSRTVLNSGCVEERTQRDEPYQLICMSASRDPTTTSGNSSGGVFTQVFADLLLSDDPNNPSGRTYRQVCLDIPCLLNGISYSEIGIVSESFRNSPFLQIN